MSRAGAAVDRVRAALAAVAAAERPEVWIALRPEHDVLAEAAAVDARTAAGERLPLAGLVAAVKNNVDVAGTPTTAACPGFATGPAAADAPAVARLRAAGAVVLGSTNLDQFATGLVGTRSPHGAVRDARRPDRISGGSSSGSAVAVALGLVDVAIGTDTAGSGRVPAALQGIVGIKATLGVVATAGVVPACRSWDAVTVLARDLPTASAAMGAVAGGAGTRPWPADAPLAAPPQPVVAVPRDLPPMAPGWAEAFAAATARLAQGGARLVEVDLAPFLAAARLLYEGALVAERHAAVGAFVDAALAGRVAAGRAGGGRVGGGRVGGGRSGGGWTGARRLGAGSTGPVVLDPVVAGIVSRAGVVSASEYVADTERLSALRARAMDSLAGCDALLLPTAPRHPTLAEVAADPLGVNAQMGVFTNFCNLFDLCAVAVPAGTAGTGALEDQVGVTVMGRPFADAVVADVAALVAVDATPPPLAAPGAPGWPGVVDPTAPSPAWPVAAGARALPLVVVGAHRRGQVLERELTGLGARWGGTVRTATSYRLLALATTPPKPGLVRTRWPAHEAGSPAGGTAAQTARVVPDSGVVGERWWLSPAALGEFLAALPSPMLLGAVELEDGTWATGFACDAVAAQDGRDLAPRRDWLVP